MTRRASGAWMRKTARRARAGHRAYLDLGVVKGRQARVGFQDEPRGGFLDPRGIQRAPHGLLFRGRLRRRGRALGTPAAKEECAKHDMRRLFGRGESGSEAYLHHGGGLFVRLGLGGRLAREDLVHRGKRVDALEEFLPVRVNRAGTVSGFLGVVLGSFSRNGTRGRNFALKRGGFDPGNVPLLPVELGAVIERHRHQPRVGVHRDEREPVLPLRVRSASAGSVFGRGVGKCARGG